MRLSLVALLLAASHALAAPVVVEQVVNREHPAFTPAKARLSVGRDGFVYVASGGNSTSYVLRISRDGKERLGGEVVYALGNATANADGVVATANAHFAHKVTLYDRNLKQTASLDDFLNNDTVGWSAPPHVEAGTSGDFYGLDHARDRIVRLNAQGKQLKAYMVPRRPEKTGRAWDFRVCEKTESFYILPQSGPMYRVGFDGQVKWVCDPKIDPGVRYGDQGNAGGVDIDGEGIIYLIGQHSDVVRLLSPEGKQTGTLTLKGGPAIPKSGSDGSIRGLRVHGDDIVLQRRDATELFCVYDRKTGDFRRSVQAQAERFRVRLDRSWTAGETAKLSIELEPKSKTPPTWRVWLRSLDEADDRELKWTNGEIDVPADLGGVYLLRVSPEVVPWRGGTQPEYLVRTWVNVRQPKTTGTMSIWTNGRTRYARGETIPVSVLLRAKGEKKEDKITLKLVDVARDKVVAKEEISVEPNVPYTKTPITCTAELAPGRYLLTAEAPGRTVAPQTVIIGAGRLEDPEFLFIQYGDYGATYPEVDAWDLPVVSAHHVERAKKLGFNMFVDRLGFPTHTGATREARKPSEYDDLLKALSTDSEGVTPEKVKLPMTLGPTMAGYSSEGMKQMAILMGNDAGLPLGTGFDTRKPEQLTKEIDRVTDALATYPAFRGWSWSSNWWVFDHRGANAAKTPEEKKQYEAAAKVARETGKWDAVLDRVAERRLGYARDAQATFNDVLKKHKGKFVTASAGPYRNVESYPPLSLSNVDEVDLQAQWEQIAVPYASAHGVDFYKRPGKRAWMHPEVWNDSGTGDQVIPTLFMGLMRGADGVGCSGPIPPWAPQPRDSRNAHPGIVSMWRSVGELVKMYGPLIRTLENADRVAIVVSGRMLKLDEWANVYGTHFARLFEAYCVCLHAHHPASYVFVDDLKPGTLEKYKAVLVIDQRVELEPELLKALNAAKKAGVKVFHDGTSRAEFVKEFTPLNISFTKFEKDPSPASDDAAYERFPKYVLANVPALRKVLDSVAERVAKTSGGFPKSDEDEILMSERVSGKGRYLFVVNNTTLPLSPGQMWRQNLLSASRKPVYVRVDLGRDAKYAYDVFALEGLNRKDVLISFHDMPMRLYAILPEELDTVHVEVPYKVEAGRAFRAKIAVRDPQGKPIDAAIPMRLRFRTGTSSVRIEERHFVCNAKGSEVVIVAPRSLDGKLRVEVAEQLSGRRVVADVELVAGKSSGFASTVTPLAAPTREVKSLDRYRADAIKSRFGPHLRDVAVSADGRTAFLTAFNWKPNVQTLDLGERIGAQKERGKFEAQGQVGHGFAFTPKAVNRGLVVQGFDFDTSAGYHLHLIEGDKLASTRRFALYGTPGRLPHRFVPSILNDRLNQFAVPDDASWVASAGNLGLVVWDRDGKERWRQDWWKTGEVPGLLCNLGTETLLLVRGVEVIALSAKDGKQQWRLTLGPSGETKRILCSADGKTIALLTDIDGGRVFVLREGKLTHRIASGGDDMALSLKGDSLAIVDGRILKFYKDGALHWTMSSDDILHHPRFSPQNDRIACSSEMGRLSVLDFGGNLVLDFDARAVAVPAFLPDGGLLVADWSGRVWRLVRQAKGTRYAHELVYSLSSYPPGGPMFEEDKTPTSRVTDWGNALAKPLSLSENLLSPTTCRIEFKSTAHSVHFAGKPEALVDGKTDPPAEPWLPWPTVGWFAESKTFNALQFDTFRRRLRVEAITLVEDAKHPESWLRDCRLEYWDAAKEQWVLAMRLLSDSATHSHKLDKPAEASRWRLVPSHLSGNLRLAEVVFHGKDLGPSHPDVLAKRPIAVLFDEGDELKTADMVHPTWGLSFAFGGAHSGGRYLKMEANRSAAPVWKPPFGHVLPDWDFEIAEKPEPGQYRYLRFAAKGLSEKTTGLTLRIDGDAYGRAVSCYAGVYKKEDDAVGLKMADAVPTEWTVYTVDLWEALKKPTRIRGMRLGATGGPAGFDRVLLERSK